jgi:hypothetical protein
MLTPEQKSLRARVAAHTMWARMRRVDTPDAERLKRAEEARQALARSKADQAPEAAHAVESAGVA